MNVAVPPFNTTVPSSVEPSLKVTLAVGTPVPPPAGATVAVRLTESPKFEGETEETSVVVVLLLMTVCNRVADVTG